MGVCAPSTEQHDTWNNNPQGVFVRKCHYADSPIRKNIDANGSPTRITSITDGTSNTVMVGERPPLWDEQNNGPWGAWSYSELDSVMGIANHLFAYSQDQNGVSCPVGPQYPQPPNPRGSPYNWCDSHHFWSRHTGGGNWVFADGSVHFLTYSVGTNVMLSLATKAGGEVVDGSAY
jgi:prepilin-type processing-associated H-X9-DG protein